MAVLFKLNLLIFLLLSRAYITELGELIVDDITSYNFSETEKALDCETQDIILKTKLGKEAKTEVMGENQTKKN